MKTDLIFLESNIKWKPRPYHWNKAAVLQNCVHPLNSDDIVSEEKMFDEFFYTLKLLLRKMSWGSLLVESRWGWIISSSKDEGKVSFSISLKYHSFKHLCDKRFNRLRLGVLLFQKCKEDLNGPCTSKGKEKGKKISPKKKEIVQKSFEKYNS